MHLKKFTKPVHIKFPTNNTKETRILNIDKSLMNKTIAYLPLDFYHWTFLPLDLFRKNAEDDKLHKSDINKLIPGYQIECSSAKMNQKIYEIDIITSNFTSDSE